METNTFDRLESWIDDLQKERRPRHAEQSDEDAELMRTTRLFKVLTSQPRVDEVFDAQMKARIASRKIRAQATDTSFRRASLGPSRGWVASFFRSSVLYSGAMALLLVVIGVGIFFQQPVGDRISLALNWRNSAVTNRIQNVNSESIAQTNQNTAPGGNQTPENKEPQGSKNVNQNSAPNVNATSNGNVNADGEPEQPATPPSTSPSNTLALDLSGLLEQQAAMTASLASVNQEFDDLDSGTDPVLISMTQDFNELSF